MLTYIILIYILVTLTTIKLFLISEQLSHEKYKTIKEIQETKCPITINLLFCMIPLIGTLIVLLILYTELSIETSIIDKIIGKIGNFFKKFKILYIIPKTIILFILEIINKIPPTGVIKKGK